MNTTCNGTLPPCIAVGFSVASRKATCIFVSASASARMSCASMSTHISFPPDLIIFFHPRLIIASIRFMSIPIPLSVRNV